MATFRTLGVINLPGGRVKPHQQVELDAATAAGLLAAGMIEPVPAQAADSNRGQDTQDLAAQLKAQTERAAQAEDAVEVLKAERDALEGRLAELLAQHESELAALRSGAEPTGQENTPPAAKPAAAPKTGKAKG